MTVGSEQCQADPIKGSGFVGARLGVSFPVPWRIWMGRFPLRP